MFMIHAYTYFYFDLKRKIKSLKTWTIDLTVSFPDILYNSPAGTMMFHIINALLLLPLDWISEMLPDILPLLSVIDCLCKMLPEIQSFEAFESEGKEVYLQNK